MNLEEFKKEIEDKYLNEIAGLKQQIRNRDEKVKSLFGEIDKLRDVGSRLYRQAREFKKMLHDFIEDESFRLPFDDPEFDEAAKVFKVFEKLE